MKKLSLVLVLVLALTCTMLASCTDGTEESSAAESIVSKTESKAETSSEADASSKTEESSKAEEVSEPEESSSDPIQGERPTELKGTNVALNKNYTGGETAITDANGTLAPYSANLTDGVAGTDGKAYDATWFALWYNVGATVTSNNAPNGIGTIVIDLGASTEKINAIRVHLNNANAAGITAAERIIASVSEDGETFTELGLLVLPEGDDPAWAEIAVDNATAQYVKLEIDMGSGSWCFLNEIEVYAGE